MLTALILSVAVPAPPAHWNHPLPYEQYRALSQCETQNNTTHSTPTYVGAFGFTRRTWDLFADTPNNRATRLTYAQQARVLDRAFWFGWRKQFPVGPWGHGCFKGLWKTSASLRQAVCNNGKQAVRRWCRR